MNSITLTDLDIERLSYGNGGYRAEVIRLIGEDVKQMGWKKRLRGRILPRLVYEEAMALSKRPALKGIQFGDSPGQKTLELF